MLVQIVNSESNHHNLINRSKSVKVSMQNQKSQKTTTRGRKGRSKVVVEEVDEFQLIQFGCSTASIAFHFSPNDMLVFKLAKLVPPRDPSIKINFQERTITGDQNLCRAYVGELKQINASMKKRLFQLKGTDNVEMKIEKIADEFEEAEFNCKVYRPKAIEFAAKKLKQFYGMQQEMDSVIQAIFKNHTRVCIMLWFEVSQESQIFAKLKQIEDQEAKLKLRVNLRQQKSLSLSQSLFPNKSKISKVSVNPSARQRVHLPKCQSSDDQEEEIQNHFYQMCFNKGISDKQENQAKNNASIMEKQSKMSQYKLKADENEDKPIRNKIQQQEKRKPLKKEWSENSQEEKDQWYQTGGKSIRQEKALILEEKYPSHLVKKGYLLGWIKKNKVITTDDFEIKKYYDEDLRQAFVIVRLFSWEDDQEKIAALNNFLRHQRLVEFQVENEKLKNQLISKCQMDGNYLKVKAVEGYRRPGTTLAVLRHKILENKIQKGYNNEPFSVFVIEGLLTLVDDKQDEIKDIIAQVPRPDLEKQILISFSSDLEGYMGEERVKNLVKKVFEDNLKKDYPQYFREVIIQQNQVLLKLKVSYQNIGNFQKTQEEIKKVFPMLVTSHPFQFKTKEKQSLKKVADRMILVNQKNTVVLIETRVKIPESIEIIMKTIDEGDRKLVEFKKTIIGKRKAQAIEKYIEKLKNQENRGFNNLKINLSKEDEETFTFTIYGLDTQVELMGNEIDNQLIFLDNQQHQYSQFITEYEAALLFKDKAFIRNIQEKRDVTLSILSDAVIDAQITLKAKDSLIKHTIMIVKDRNITNIPEGCCLIFNSKNDLEEYKDEPLVLELRKKIGFIQRVVEGIPEYQNSSRNCRLAYINDTIENQLSQGLRSSSAQHNQKTIAFLMPKSEKKKFVDEILSRLHEIKNMPVSMLIFQRKSKAKLESVLELKTNVKKDQILLYVEVEGKRLYYSESGQKKIAEAQKNGHKKVYLENEDFNCTNVTHICNVLQQTMVHVRSGKSFDFKLNQIGTIEYELKGRTYFFPKNIVRKIMKAVKKEVEISLCVYELNFEAKEQTNLFTDSKKTVCVEKIPGNVDIPYKRDLKVEYSVSRSKWLLTYEPENEEGFGAARQEIEDFFEDKSICLEIDVKKANLTAQIEEILTQAEDIYDLSAVYDEMKGILTVRGYDQREFDKFKSMLKSVGLTQIA